MMNTVRSFSISNLRKEEMLGFCRDISNKIVDVKEVSESDAGTNFKELMLSYAEKLDDTRELSYHDIVEADARVDSAIVGLRSHLQALLGYPRDNIREAARIIWNAIEQYGSPVHLPYNEEYAIVSRMLDTLEAIDPEILTEATVEAWIPALRQRFTEFETIKKDFDSERTVKTASRIKSAQNALCRAWKTLTLYINGLAVVQSSPALEKLIGEINTCIQSKKSAIKLRKTLKKSSEEAACEPVSIEK